MRAIGARIRRKEDYRLLTGQGEYVDDVVLPRMLYAVIVRSTHAHARIRRIDSTKALKLAGVVMCVASGDLPDLRPIPVRMGATPAFTPYLQYPLARERVRYVGEPVAVVLAESRYLAEDARALVEVEYDPLPAAMDAELATRTDAPRLYETGNSAAEWVVQVGEIERTLKDADFLLRERFKIQRHTAVPVETRGLVAEYHAGRGTLRVWGPTKVPYFNRAVLAAMLELGEEQVHFIEPDVGGSFGVRGEFYPEDFLIPYLSIRAGRPVKWIEDRREHFQAINHSREQVWDLTVAVSRTGMLLGIDARLVNDMGAYLRTHGTLVPAVAASHLPGPYRIPHYRCKVSCVMTNKTPTGTIRGPGLFEGNFVRERALDLVARELGLDPAEIRRRNLLVPEDMPYAVGTDIGGIPTVYDSGNFPRVFDEALVAAGYQASRLEAGASDGFLTGVGIAAMVEPTGFGPFEGARVAVDGRGKVYVYTGATSQGQGQETTLAQICSDVLGVEIDDIVVRHGDTTLLRFGVGTYASRTTVMAGSAVYQASLRVKEKALRLAAQRLEAAPADLILVNGHVHVVGAPARAMSLSELAQMASPLGLGIRQEGDETEELAGLSATAYFRYSGHWEATSVFTVHLATVAVDCETGAVTVVRYLVAADVGRAINPMLVEGQLAGGVIQGLGGALKEELVYEPSGQLLTTTLMDYGLPTASEAPPIHTVIMEEAVAPSNPLGVKGIGEVGTSGAGAAIANAVADALRPLGVRITELPLTSQRVLTKLWAARPGQGHADAR